MNAEVLSRKKRIRAGHKSSTTRTITQVYDILGSEHDIQDANVSRLRQQLAVLREKLELLKQLNEEILELLKEEDVVDEIEQADIFSEKIHLALIDLEIALKSHDEGSTTRPSDVRSSLEPPAPPPGPTHPVSRESTARVKLPKLMLKKFDGNITNWITFWDSFESAIHNNPDLSKVDKFNYLTSVLERSAAEAISGLTLTAANYDEAVTILKKRFGNKQQIVNKHMEVLLNVESVTSHSNIKGLRRLYDLIESHVRALKALGVSSESYGTLLTSVLMNKLPSELRLIVSRKTSEDDWELDGLMKLMEQEINAMERAGVNSVPPARRPTRDSPTAAALMSSDSKPICSFCEHPHSSNHCRTVTDPEARKHILRRTGRCFVCLKKYHISKQCRSSMRCSTCNGKHHVSICSQLVQKPVLPNSSVNSVNEGSQRLTPTAQEFIPDVRPKVHESLKRPTVSMYVNTRTPILLQTARASLYNPQFPQVTTNARIILDSGSQRSYITNRVKDSLSLRTIQSEILLIKTFGSSDDENQECEVVKLGIKLKDGDHVELPLFSVPFICEPLSNQSIDLKAPQYSYLMDLDLADPPCEDGKLEVDVLIGCDHYWTLVAHGIIRREEGITAIKTKLGWVLSGPVRELTHQTLSTNTLSTHSLRVDSNCPQSGEEDMDENLKRFWELESFGIKKNENSVYEKFTDEISFKHGRYEVRLPWKDSHPILPDNYQISLKRLSGLLKRLRQEPHLLRDYDNVVKDQLRKGIVEAVDDHDSEEVGRVHYLPHHAVIRKDKQTSKLRIVYDASARGSGPSLNDCLYTGPKFGQNIMEILLRFRIHNTALAGDIEKAFLMVAVAPEDRNVLRFLWIDDIEKEQPNIQILRFARVVFGVSSSPFLLNATVKHHIEGYRQEDPEFVDKFLRSIYVDDLSCGAEDDNGAYEMYVKSRLWLAEGGFALRKFVTNSSTLQERIDINEQKLQSRVLSTTKQEVSEDQSYAKQTLGDEMEESNCNQRILGVCWNFVDDELVFDVSRLTRDFVELEPTKRNVVSIASRFYDPLGIVSPVTIQFKILFQKLCLAKVPWDEPISGELLKKWQLLLFSLRNASPICIPRCYFAKSFGSFSLIGFCDASAEAYAAVVYLRLSSGEQSNVRILASKTRVAPISGQTIPRLELLSALLLARLMRVVSQALESEILLGTPMCFTDSRIALYWIKGQDKEWKQFVENRVCDIRKLLPTECWRHCPSVDNPADLPSRGMHPQELKSNSLWFSGPEWLCHVGAQEEDDAGKSMPEECLTEIKAKHRQEVTTMLTNSEQCRLSQIMNCEDYSTVKRLLMVTGLVLKFVKLLKRQTQDVALTSDELLRAEELWIIESQKSLVCNRNFKSWERQFGLFRDKEGIWRCGGRLERTDLPQPTIHPILLDKEHPLTRLIIRNCHEIIKHNGVKETLTQLRSKYWIIRGRSLVRKLLHSCVVCRKAEGKPFLPLPPPPLPEFRVTEQPPFTYTGVDFAGPLYVKDSSGTSKVWICLYTCCVVRAVHLDLVPNLCASTFIRSFKRFTARRGFPRRVISDNGKTFKSAAKHIERILKDPEINRYFAQLHMEWKFNLERAPWWGGMFERMVRSTKRCLKKTIGRARLTYDELLTALAEVEMILNSRPLSYVSTEDLEEPLTPSHLLIGRRALNLPDMSVFDGGDEDDYDPSVSSSDLSRRAKHLGNTLDHFWQRWRHEYLIELRESHRYMSAKGSQRRGIVSVGDIVLVFSDTQPRGLWKLAKVEKLMKGSDGRVRGALVKVGTKKKASMILKRPIQHLYPLEINCRADEKDESNVSLEIVQPKPTSEFREKRPLRKAAKEGRNRVKSWIKELSK